MSIVVIHTSKGSHRVEEFETTGYPGCDILPEKTVLEFDDEEE